MTRPALAVALVLVVAASRPMALDAGRATSEPVVREVVLMGTLARLATADDDRARGLARLERALGALEAAERTLSTWRADSEISRINVSPAGASIALSGAVCRYFRELDRWTRDTGGAFDAAIGALTSAWDVHGAGRVPDAAALATARARSGWSRLGFDPVRCTVSRAPGVTIDVGAFGKGAALDEVAATLDGDPHPWLADLGGQVAARGRPQPAGWPIAIAHPLARHQAIVELALHGASMATSAGSERDLVVNGRRVGHILDPRTGRSASFSGSITIRHRSALVADVLSTALFVMGPDEGLRWADAHGIEALYLEPMAGDSLVHRASRPWRRSRAASDY